MVTMLILFLLLIVPASGAHAQSDSVRTALLLVEEFHAEALTLATEAAGVAAGSSFHKKSVESKEKAVAEINSLKWTATPGQKRFESVSSVMEKYMDEEIQAFGKLSGPRNNNGVKKAVARLRGLKDEKLEELGKSLPYETYEKKERAPVPIIDTSPYEKEPGGEKGLWYR